MENNFKEVCHSMTLLTKKQNKILTIASCILFTVFLPAAAQEKTAEETKSAEPVVLTIDQAVEYANTNSRTLKSAQIDLEMKERASKYAWNVFVPTVTASGTATRSNDYIPSWSNAVYNVPAKYNNEKERWTGIGNINASLNLSLALISKISIAHANFEAGKITWTKTVHENEMNVRKLFYALLLQQENLKVQETSLENARQRARQAETNYKNGMVPELSMLQAQVTYENQRPSVDKQRQAVDQQLDTFAFMLGMPVGTKIELTGKIEPQFIELDANEIYRKYSTNNLDVQNIRKNLSVLKMSETALDLSSYTPALALSWNYQPILMSSGEWKSGSDLYDNGSLSITLAWTISDMLPFSANRQNAKDVKDNIRKLEVSLDTVMQNNELTVKKSVDSLKQAKDAIESNERNIKLAQRSYDMTAIAYRNGTKELLDLRDAETQLNQAKLGMLNEQYNYLSYLLDLEYTLNTKLTGESK